jgi:ribose/xylose/arabinose/galactoside ABC-type transport system permease subunit
VRRISLFGRDSVTPSLAIVYALMVLVFSLINPRFFSLGNSKAIMASLAISGIVAVGLTPVILTRNFDISIGSIFGLSMVVVAKLFNVHGTTIPIVVIMLAGLSVGVIIGAINGFLITKIGINSIIVTLGTLAIFRGLTFYWSLDNISIPKEAFLRIGRYFVLGVVPLPFIYFIALLALGHFLLRHAPTGRKMYLVGANPAAARLAGINISRSQFIPFIVSGFMAALGGVINASQVGFANSTFGTGYEFKILTIVVLGGISLNGGRGALPGVFFATLIIGSISNGLALIDIPINWRDAFIGIILIVAISVDSLQHQMRTTGLFKTTKRVTAPLKDKTP